MSPIYEQCGGDLLHCPFGLTAKWLSLSHEGGHGSASWSLLLDVPFAHGQAGVTAHRVGKNRASDNDY